MTSPFDDLGSMLDGLPDAPKSFREYTSDEIMSGIKEYIRSRASVESKHDAMLKINAILNMEDAFDHGHGSDYAIPHTQETQPPLPSHHDLDVDIILSSPVAWHGVIKFYMETGLYPLHVGAATEEELSAYTSTIESWFRSQVIEYHAGRTHIVIRDKISGWRYDIHEEEDGGIMKVMDRLNGGHLTTDTD